MKNYEQIDISGDVGLCIRGQSLEELFENAAMGMSELIADVRGIEDTEEKNVTVTSGSYEDALIQWLNELVFLYDTYDFIGKKFHADIKKNTANQGTAATAGSNNSIRLDATVSGGFFNPEINEGRLLIKAATYHDLSLKKIDSGWEAVVIFDI
jgi:SHS2 domain-containing protein